MSEPLRVIGFLAVMVVTMPAYLWIGPQSIVAGRHVTMLAPAAMAIYLGFVAYWRPPEAALQRFWLLGAIGFTVSAAISAEMWWTGAWRGLTFGLHAMAWTGLAIWWWQRPGRGALFVATLLAVWVLQGFNMIENGVCSLVASEPALADASVSACVRVVGSPLYMLAPIAAVTATFMALTSIWRRW